MYDVHNCLTEDFTVGLIEFRALSERHLAVAQMLQEPDAVLIEAGRGIGARSATSPMPNTPSGDLSALAPVSVHA